MVTIAVALRRIKKIKNQISELSDRAQMSVSYSEKNVPTFDFDEEVKKLDSKKRTLVKLEAAVAVANATNSITFKKELVTLAEAIRRLQELKDDISFYQRLPIFEGVRQEREHCYDEVNGNSYVKTVDIKWLSKLSEKERIEKIDALKNEFEDLNNILESANHRIEISTDSL